MGAAARAQGLTPGLTPGSIWLLGLCFLAMNASGQPLGEQALPAVLQITIERLHDGAEARYGAIEERMLEICVRLGCPNAYLALESVDAPKEVWWLVEYADDADRERVATAYQENPPLLAALGEAGALKKDLVDPPVEHFARPRSDASTAAASWRVGIDPFVVIAPRAAPGAVYESAERLLFTFATAASAADAARAAAGLGADARVFRVQPAWSQPKDDWARANPTLWRR